jgi:hypothetical protein
MTEDEIECVVGVRRVPASARMLSSLPRIDYGDRVSMSTDSSATPEQWARAMFGDEPNALQVVIWRGFLGLRLTRGRSSELVAGWRVGGRGDGWIRLEATSWLLYGNLVVEAARGQVALGTYLHYRRRLGRAVWFALSPVHRRLAPGLLPSAAARLRRPRGSSSSNGNLPSVVEADEFRLRSRSSPPPR